MPERRGRTGAASLIGKGVEDEHGQTKVWNESTRLGLTCTGAREYPFQEKGAVSGSQGPIACCDGIVRSSLGNSSDNGRPAIFADKELDRPFRVEIIMKGDIIDVALEKDCQKRCLTNRFPEQHGDTLFRFVRDGNVTFRDIRFCRLLGR